MKVITWEFGGNYSDKIVSSNLAITNKILLSKGLWEGFQFSICGLGLNKREREFFNTKFLEVRDIINIYLGKWVISYNKKGNKDQLSSVDIISERKVSNIFKDKYNRLKQKYNINKLINKFLFKTQYNFGLDKYWDGDYKFTSDMLSAFQLASNYEADLYFKGHLVFSPLGYEWEENAKAIKKHLGKRFVKSKSFNLMGYKSPGDPEIKNYKRIG